jgi:hypothetical protein
MTRRKLPPLALLALAPLAGCGSPTPPPTYAPLNYSYLPPITLKVANLSVVNNYVPDPGAATLIAQDPVQPADTLTQLLNQRLIANGTPGNATATIDTASIDQDGSNLTGTMTVEIQVASPDGLRTGYTEATVTQSDPAPDPDSSQTDVATALYTLTKQLMDAMNIQLQYQIDHNLPSWVVQAGAAMPGVVPGSTAAPGPIEATPLTGPDQSTPDNAAPAPADNSATPTEIPPGPPMQLVPATPPPEPATPTPSPAPATPAPFNPANVGL